VVRGVCTLTLHLAPRARAPSQKEVVMATTARPQASTSSTSAQKNAQQERPRCGARFIAARGDADEVVTADARR
jgi:hypothetical protein